MSRDRLDSELRNGFSEFLPRRIIRHFSRVSEHEKTAYSKVCKGIASEAVVILVIAYGRRGDVDYFAADSEQLLS
jgi:hypothetical protein